MSREQSCPQCIVGFAAYAAARVDYRYNGSHTIFPYSIQIADGIASHAIATYVLLVAITRSGYGGRGNGGVAFALTNGGADVPATITATGGAYTVSPRW
jgi:hypothetical protein